uniref:AMP-binding protein n=1 Tax=Altererythrobacter segetis TaxID=1104773 RepID=UPI001407DAD3|nr:AMP-binding protein [Altererythrobacter segetis]
MTRLLAAIQTYAERAPAKIALDPIDGPPVTYAALPRRVEEALAGIVNGEGPVALQLDHGVETALLELACLEAGVPVLSLPLFFTDSQRRHALAESGATLLLTGGNALGPWSPSGPVALPVGTARITFTSGSSGNPKGVCLSADHLLAVAEEVVRAVGTEHAGRHLALLPSGVLLETVAGFFTTMLAGGTYVCPPQALAGMADPFRPDFALLARRLAEWRITSLILVPELLAGLVAALETSGERLPLLTMVAVGGARTPPTLMTRARALGLPVRQGYGLTECGSVATLEDPSGGETGSVGRPLGHLRARIADDGEVLLDGPLCLGLLGGEAPRSPFATGDIGRIDGDGRLWIEGRKSNLIVTGHGRNISPEWIEEALLARAEIAQAFVYGDGLPFPQALLVPAAPGSDLAAAVASVNASLPGYARLASWREVAHFTPDNGRLTGNGRLKRKAIEAAYLPAPDFFTELGDATVRQRLAFLAVPQVRAGLAGTISRETYIDYLTQAYHHVRHTVPLMVEARARLGDRPELVEALDEYIAEETGHEEWILADIAAAGGDADAARRSRPHRATQSMVDHAYDRIRAGNPVSFFGMVYVLESVSVALATRGAGAVALRLGLPPEAFTYLTSHGALDRSHMRFLQSLVNELGDETDRAAVRDMAREIFVLFGGMFGSIELEPADALV